MSYPTSPLAKTNVSPFAESEGPMSRNAPAVKVRPALEANSMALRWKDVAKNGAATIPAPLLNQAK